jgi:hypothetical protein
MGNLPYGHIVSCALKSYQESAKEAPQKLGHVFQQQKSLLYFFPPITFSCFFSRSLLFSGGIFMFGMNNDVIGNHVVGHEHGLWTPGSSQPNGRPFGYSLGKVGRRREVIL